MKKSDSLQRLRAEIDRLDGELLRLLNQRAQLGADVCRLKRAAGLPICDPEREAEVIGRARQANRGPLDIRAIENIFRQIIEETRKLEEQQTVAAE